MAHPVLLASNGGKRVYQMHERDESLAKEVLAASPYKTTIVQINAPIVGVPKFMLQAGMVIDAPGHFLRDIRLFRFMSNDEALFFCTIDTLHRDDVGLCVGMSGFSQKEEGVPVWACANDDMEEIIYTSAG